MLDYLATRLFEEVEHLLASRNWTALRTRLQDLPPREIADMLLLLEPSEAAVLFRVLPRSLAADVFAALEKDQRQSLLKQMSDRHVGQLLADMRPDDRTHLLEELPGELTQQMLNLLDAEDMAEARQLLGYPEDSVGRLMTPDYVAVRPNWTVRQALEHIREWGHDSETVNTVYVVDGHWRLLDGIMLRRFMLAQPEQFVADLMDSSVVTLSALEDREEAVHLIQHYDLDTLPVVDSDGVLIGIVTIDDVLDVAQEEATEDFHKGAALVPMKSYREASMLQLYGKRIGWLMILIVVNLISSSVIAAYESVLVATISLAFFIPLLIDSGGNAGSQSATLLVRALATGDIRLHQWLRTLGREIAIGAMMGVTLGLASSGLGIFRGGPKLGIVVGLSMTGIIIVANVIGAMLPFLLTRLRIDPAVASSPLITTIADACGLLIYFSIASAILGTGT
jgi:magnesium transporter